VAEPLFSIVTVTLDAGALLATTASSVDRQTCRDLEHVVKDGGSTDGSLEALPPSPLRRIERRRDAGIYDAMNQALDGCRGRYVLFLNAGDTLAAPDVLASVARALCCDDILYCDIANAEFGLEVRSPPRLTRFFLFRNTVCHQACFVRRDLLRRLGGFDASLRIAADHDFLARAVLRSGARARHIPLTAVRYLGDGVSSRRRDLARKEFALIRRRNYGPVERALLGSVWALTLPALRRRLLTNDRFAVLRKHYVRAKDALYGLGERRR
jgi:GT2 family glycosyltransferase